MTLNQSTLSVLYESGVWSNDVSCGHAGENANTVSAIVLECTASSESVSQFRLDLVTGASATREIVGARQPAASPDSPAGLSLINTTVIPGTFPFRLAMFSPAVGRVARSANTFSAAPLSVLNVCARSALSTSTTPQQPFRPNHQRRYSSSKPSTPANNKKKPAELDQNATAELQGAGQKSKGPKKLKQPSTATLGNNVPFVPPTNHLREDGKASETATLRCVC